MNIARNFNDSRVDDKASPGELVRRSEHKVRIKQEEPSRFLGGPPTLLISTPLGQCVSRQSSLLLHRACVTT